MEQAAVAVRKMEREMRYNLGDAGQPLQKPNTTDSPRGNEAEVPTMTRSEDGLRCSQATAKHSHAAREKTSATNLIRISRRITRARVPRNTHLGSVIGEQVHLLHAQQRQRRHPVLQPFSVHAVERCGPHAQGHLHVAASLAAFDDLEEEVQRPVPSRVLRRRREERAARQKPMQKGRDEAG